MSSPATLRWPLWLIKLFNYEYWDWWVFYLPLFPFWLYYALRARSLSFFTAANPGIEAGGFFGERKMDILRSIDPAFKPITLLIPRHTSLRSLWCRLEQAGLSFPLILKPNVGERGTEVEKISNKWQLARYLARSEQEIMVQEYIDHEIEMGVLYYRFPNEPRGQVSSITLKKFLSVTGDGVSTIDALAEQSTRARFQLKRLHKQLGKGMQEVLPQGEVRVLEVIGNHCRGTLFYSGNYLIDSRLHEVFTRIAQPIAGFYYGRFDVRVRSLEELYAGEGIKVLELNGVSGEPTHIYDPSYSLPRAYRDFLFHVEVVYQIARQNMEHGVKPVPFKELLGVLRSHFA